MSNEQKQIIDKLTETNNVLVTVSSDPSVDQLSSAIGLSLFLNSLGKQATVVFSGKIPSTIEFLKPEKTISKNTDSLRDFIIALDKSKADKLRYKIEDKHVKIFITPYRTTLKAEDLNFSQGDFNVDTIVALGVHQQKDLDKAVTAHGQILHDATVISVNTTTGSAMGSISWVETKYSSLCEMIVEVCEALKEDAFDAQTATALLTGIVAETDRFSNDKTKSSTMSTASKLMAAGANQQLVAMQLHSPKVDPEDLPKPVEQPRDETKPEKEKPKEPPKEKPKEKPQDGMLSISHEEEDGKPSQETPEEEEESGEQEVDHDEIHIDDKGTISPAPKFSPPSLVEDPPSLGGTLTSNAKPEGLDPSTDPFSFPSREDTNPPILDRSHTDSPQDSTKSQTLKEIEEAFDSPHVHKDKKQDKTNDKDKDKNPPGAKKDDDNSPPPLPPPLTGT